MASSVGGLYVDLGLNSAEFNNSLKKAGTELDKFGGRAQGQMGKASAAFSTMAANARAAMSAMPALAGALAALGVTQGLSTLRQVASSIADMSAEAKKAGIAVEPFQELEYAAGQAKVSTDALSDGLKEMQLRADEFILTGKGSGAEAFQRLGFSADKLKESLKDPVMLFEEIIDRLKKFDTAAQIRISDEVFGGTGGEQFVRFLEESRKSIAEARAEARDLGLVMDSELVSKASDLNAKFEQLSLTFEARMKGAIVNVATTFDSWAQSVQTFMTSMGNWSGWAKLSAGYTPPAGVTKIDPNDPMSIARARLAAGLAAGQKSALRKGTSEDWVWTPDPNAGKPATKAKGPKNAYDYDDLHKSSQLRLADLQTEQAALGMTTEAAAAYRFEQDALAAAKMHDITLTPEQTAQMRELAAQYGRVTVEIEQTRLSQQRMQEMQQELGNIATSSITGLINGTKSLNDVLSDTLDLMAQMLLKSALLGEGPLGSGGGGLLGAVTKGLTGALSGGTTGWYATGGYTGAGGKYDPAGVVHRGEVVWSQDDIRRAGGVAVVEAMRRGAKGYANGGPVSVPSMAARGLTLPKIQPVARGASITSHLSIDARGSNMTADQIRAVVGPMLRANNEQVMKAVPGAVNKARGRMTEADKRRF
ncbi:MULTISPECIES: phage tail tape measure protein [unclassified Xanthobacter]|uniref:phage tail tape measure protein n=1 Tax=unclassified Xanthobacter TaxID=2623496 RepID=UPI001F24BA1D|nr:MULTISPECIES: phage tail tape measure protein [unclassified Xanthobacter]